MYSFTIKYLTQVKVLKSIPPIEFTDVVLGQYEGKKDGTDEEKQGYLDDPTVPAGQLSLYLTSFSEVINKFNSGDCCS